MKLIICGGRTYNLTQADYYLLDVWHKLYNFTEVVSGGAPGADHCGENWAKKNNIHVEPFNAQWSIYGKSAGPKRNQQMALYADACAVFPGGKGTADMERKAKAANLLILKPV